MPDAAHVSKAIFISNEYLDSPYSRLLNRYELPSFVFVILFQPFISLVFVALFSFCPIYQYIACLGPSVASTLATLDAMSW